MHSNETNMKIIKIYWDYKSCIFKMKQNSLPEQNFKHYFSLQIKHWYYEFVNALKKHYSKRLKICNTSNPTLQNKVQKKHDVH